ncbi:hypothetical protein THAOC_25494 [Thalassiosira oceanica]|uniref:Uncharacterized protein n=1 Tax=Thalassiosira oceanica TaxID=159749 RepID=K0RR30_THAOC|nr:hypothetical protein THAOC_25494 [Thalassiosira oceanica]|eukprot:EJK54844.1 hypothetical protein THAOC_25494 [Thalassiosira oceanica]
MSLSFASIDARLDSRATATASATSRLWLLDVTRRFCPPPGGRAGSRPTAGGAPRCLPTPLLPASPNVPVLTIPRLAPPRELPPLRAEWSSPPPPRLSRLVAARGPVDAKTARRVHGELARLRPEAVVESPVDAVASAVVPAEEGRHAPPGRVAEGARGRHPERPLGGAGAVAAVEGTAGAAGSVA